MAGAGSSKKRSLKQEADEVRVVVEACSKVFAGRDPGVVGAALADLLALLLAGYLGPDAPRLREELLEGHIAGVRALIPVNEKIIMDGMVDDSASQH